MSPWYVVWNQLEWLAVIRRVISPGPDNLHLSEWWIGANRKDAAIGVLGFHNLDQLGNGNTLLTGKSLATT